MRTREHADTLPNPRGIELERRRGGAFLARQGAANSLKIFPIRVHQLDPKFIAAAFQRIELAIEGKFSAIKISAHTVGRRVLCHGAMKGMVPRSILRGMARPTGVGPDKALAIFARIFLDELGAGRPSLLQMPEPK